jgi:mannose-6-phosphate isomerase-like protein (cupin superfamily)
VNITPSGRLVSASSDGLSRRTVVGAGTTGLALALLARSISQATAQDATPAAEGGMPAGVAATSLINIPVPATDVPADGFTLSLARLTFEVGAVSPDSTLAYPEIAYVESGTLICPGGAPRFIIAADGSVREIGEGDFPVETGEAIYVPANVLDGGRNDGPEPLSILVIDLLPMEAMATPAA